MSNWNILTVEITSASVSDFLTTSNLIGITFRDIRYLDDLRIQVRVSGFDYLKLDRLASKRGDSVKVVAKSGLYFTGQRYLRRPVLIVGVVLWLIMVLYLPTRVLFVRVDGNHAVDSLRIIEAAEKCGIHFGASRRYVRSEKVKNLLLSEIDSLQWAGVNTYGCVAVISVKERIIPSETTENHRINSIVAARDGIISEITVIKGNPVCKVGQAVRTGQMLVSGYTDCGLSLKADSADAEILALTSRSLTAVTLSSGIKRTNLQEIKVRYSIQIGKNVVKLYNDSGNSNARCVKMYSQKYLTLPGGFELPISLIEERLSFCDEEISLSDGDFAWMEQSAEAYLQSDMVAGRILRGSVCAELLDGIYCINGVYTCEEMIGQKRIEEIVQHNGEGNC